MSDPSSGGWQAFRERNFRFYAAGRFLTAAGQHIQTVGVGLYVYELTRDPLALGLAGLVTFLPQILLVAFSGHVADSFDRRLISAITYLVNAASAVGLFLFVASGSREVAVVYLLIALVGASRVFGMPANQAMLPNLVPDRLLPSAIAWSASVVQSAIIIGPAIGGFLYIVGPKVVFATAACMHVAASYAMWRIKAQVRPVTPDKFSWSAFTTGASFIWSRKALLGAISLDLVAVLFAGVGALLPIYATDILDAGPTGLGMLRASQAVGALGMALFLSQFPIRRNAGVWVITAACIFGLSIIGFGLSRVLWLSMACMVIEGAADMVSVVVRLSIVQSETPDAMRGRVSSVNALFIGASNSLGEFESGLAASLLGTVPATLAGGGLAVLTALVWARIFPDLRKRDTL